MSPADRWVVEGGLYAVVLHWDGSPTVLPQFTLATRSNLVQGEDSGFAVVGGLAGYCSLP